MRNASPTDRHKVIEILTESFSENPGVDWIFSSNKNKKKKLKKLAEYAYAKCIHSGQVFISSNDRGVALIYKEPADKWYLDEKLKFVKFGLYSIPLLRIQKVLKRESFRKSVRLKNIPHYYFWFLGVLKYGENAGLELNQGVIDLCKKEKIPLFLETSVERNKMIYERLGYESYFHWTDDSKNISFWFMKYDRHLNK